MTFEIDKRLGRAASRRLRLLTIGGYTTGFRIADGFDGSELVAIDCWLPRGWLGKAIGRLLAALTRAGASVE